MARQSMSSRKVRKIAAQTGLQVMRVLVRGGTDHRRDLLLADGSVVHLFKDGAMERSTFVKWYPPIEAKR